MCDLFSSIGKLVLSKTEDPVGVWYTTSKENTTFSGPSNILVGPLRLEHDGSATAVVAGVNGYKLGLDSTQGKFTPAGSTTALEYIDVNYSTLIGSWSKCKDGSISVTLGFFLLSSKAGQLGTKSLSAGDAVAAGKVCLSLKVDCDKVSGEGDLYIHKLEDEPCQASKTCVHLIVCGSRYPSCKCECE